MYNSPFVAEVECLERHEIFKCGAGLAAVVELGAALKVPEFSSILPFALLPATLCAGAAVYFHSKLPKDKKCPLFRWHPVWLFLSLLLGNIILLLLPLIELWRR